MGAVLSHLPTLIHSVPQLYLYVACVILGLIAGVLAFKLEKMILTVATAASGAAMLVLVQNSSWRSTFLPCRQRHGVNLVCGFTWGAGSPSSWRALLSSTRLSTRKSWRVRQGESHYLRMKSARRDR